MDPEPQAAELRLGIQALEEGDPRAAAAAAERALREVPETKPLDAIPALELLMRARMSMGDLGAAEQVCESLDKTAHGLGTPYLVGRALLAVGELAEARGDHEKACQCREEAHALEGRAP